MNCPQCENVSAYMDDAMASLEHKRFAGHLATCPLCRQYLDELLALQSNLRKLPSPGLGFDLAAQFEERLRSLPPRRAPVRNPWWGRSFGGAAVTASLILGVWLGGLLIGSTAALPASAGAARVFDPVPPGGLCAASELCGLSRGLQ